MSDVVGKLFSGVDEFEEIGSFFPGLESPEVPELFDLEEGGGSSRFSTSQILGGTFTALSAFGTITAGLQQSAALKTEARGLDRAATKAQLEGAASAINESIRATESIGSQIISDPASLSGSSAKSILAEFEDSRTNINLARLSGEQIAAETRAEAERTRDAAGSAVLSGVFNAASDVAMFGLF